jgi:type IV pilus assembly protein PilM
MDVESYATEEAFRMIAPSLPANARDQNVALVDIGAHVMHFYVLRNNQILFSRDQAFGGNQLTHDIQRAFNLSPEEAESAKKNAGLPENYDADVLQPFMETLALEVTRALQFFFTSTSYSQVDQVVLTGGCALLSGLDELVAKRAGVTTIVGNPFASMTASRCAGSNSHDPRQPSAPPRAETPGASAPIHLAGCRPRGARRRARRPGPYRHCRPDRKPERA